MSLVPFPTPEELQASMSHLGEKKAFQKLALRWVKIELHAKLTVKL